MIEVKVNTTNLQNRLRRLQSKLDKLPEEAHKEFVRLTPIGDPNRWKTKYKPKNYKPGNARRNTTLQGETIKANYPYAQRLNEGYSSQAPQGMIQPLLKFLRKRVKDIVRGK